MTDMLPTTIIDHVSQWYGVFAVYLDELKDMLPSEDFEMVKAQIIPKANQETIYSKIGSWVETWYDLHKLGPRVWDKITPKADFKTVISFLMSQDSGSATLPKPLVQKIFDHQPSSFGFKEHVIREQLQTWEDLYYNDKVRTQTLVELFGMTNASMMGRTQVIERLKQMFQILEHPPKENKEDGQPGDPDVELLPVPTY